MADTRADQLRSFAVTVLQRLREAGYEALWAGGCVRDLVLGMQPKDYDVATNARPADVCKLFRRTFEVGASFGVVRVLGGRGIDVEVATFRTDLQYSDGRRPDAVEFSTPEEDAKRRDFTINGMFFDPLTRTVHDYVGGQADIDGKVIRAIGVPAQRFAEDKLRLLRGIRFAARLDFRIDEATSSAIRRMAGQIGVVSAERIFAELKAMLTPATRVRALELLRAHGLFEHVFAELAGDVSSEAQWQRMLAVMSWPFEASTSLAFAGLLASIGDERAPEVAETLLRRLKASNEEREMTHWLVARRRDFDDAPKTRLSKLKRLFAHPGCGLLLEYHQRLAIAAGRGTSDADYCRRLLEQLTAREIDPPPLLDGNDLIALGLTPGPHFKELLDRVRDLQLDGALTTKAEAQAFVQKQNETA